MKLSASDIDFAKLTERERATLEQVIPKIEDGYDLREIAKQLGGDHQQLARDVENLAARVMALSGRIELPPHSPEEYEALKASIKANGQQLPILIGSPTSALPGETIDGHGRRKICAELRITPKTREVDGTADELRSLGLVLNLARRHMNASSRRGIIKAELLRAPERSDRAIATTAGVSATTVGSVRRELEQAGVVSKLDTRLGQDGVTQPAARVQERALPAERAIRVLVDADLFEQYVGPWVSCSAFRLLERRPGVHELQVQLTDPVLASDAAIAQLCAAAATLADRLGREPADIVRELVTNAAEVFGREIPGPSDLYTDEAAWATDRMTELATLADA